MQRALLFALAFAVSAPAEGRDLRARTLRKTCRDYAATTNRALRSEEIDRTTYPAIWQGATTQTQNSASCPLLNGTAMDLVSNTAGTNGDAVFQQATFGTTVFAGSIHAAATSGTAAITISTNCNSGVAVTACTCSRSDRGECTATVDSHRCVASTAVGTTVVRLAAIVTCAAGSNPILALWPGDRGVSTGAVCLGGAQLEAGGAMTPYIATTSAAVTRPAGCYR